jgi:hypothetical protein
MVLTNAQKQRRYRERHADARRRVARIANHLMRRSHSEGRPSEAKVGWNDVTFDRYFFVLARMLSDALKTDRAIRQLRWALAICLDHRRNDRRSERVKRKLWLRTHPGMTSKEFRRLRNIEVAQWLEAERARRAADREAREAARQKASTGERV